MQYCAGVADNAGENAWENSDIETLAAELGLVVIQRVMEVEIQQKLGRWGQPPFHRHGYQPGHVTCFAPGFGIVDGQIPFA